MRSTHCGPVPEPIARPDDLDPIETASLDELRALQTERLRRSVRHAWTHVPHSTAPVEGDVADPGSVERSVGKMRRLVDRRPVR